ncbi:MAG: sulfatase-like hydrolase/transferase, partial [Planctomycetales bacterium]|nr:sulfatase-like hydrolase/transferase [Planctomycetales bacterium]
PLLKQAGYTTAMIGKWHLGWDWPIPAERSKLFKQVTPNANEPTNEQRAVWRQVFEQPIPGGPSTRGFDLYFGTDVPNWPPYCFIENDHTVGIPSDYLAPDRLKKNQASKQGPALTDWKLEPILPTLGDRASRFIAGANQSTSPYLIYIPLTAPHTPLSVNDQWKGKSGLGLYGDFVMETDAIVGQVLDAIDQSGQSDNTFVLFTSDNGCAPYVGVEELEKNGHFPSGPLRGYKADAWEGGHRVPFIVRWPGVVSPATVCEHLVHQADLIATIAEVLDVELPADAGEDSFSLVSLLGGGSHPIRENSISCSIRGVPSLRQGQWKYIAAPGSGGWGTGGDQSQPLQLYNLANDLDESENLASAEPERLFEMQAKLEKLITAGRSNPGPPQNNDVPVRRYPADAGEPATK